MKSTLGATTHGKAWSKHMPAKNVQSCDKSDKISAMGRI
jgi:hypothetical protein